MRLCSYAGSKIQRSTTHTDYIEGPPSEVLFHRISVIKFKLDLESMIESDIITDPGKFCPKSAPSAQAWST